MDATSHPVNSAARQAANPATVAVLLRRLAACRRRNKDLSTSVAQLRISRDDWKRKATARRGKIYRLQRKAKPKPSPHWTTGLTDDEVADRRLQHRRVVNRILAIPPRRVI